MSKLCVSCWQIMTSSAQVSGGPADTVPMGSTSTQRKRQMTCLDEQGLLDRSQKLWTDPKSGWSIVRLTTIGCAMREGILMHNCLDTELPSRLWKLPIEAVRADAPDELMAIHERNRSYCMEPQDHFYHARYYSVRDKDNHPRATFVADSDSSAPWDIRGHGNSIAGHDILQIVDRAVTAGHFRKITGQYYEWADNPALAVC